MKQLTKHMLRPGTGMRNTQHQNMNELNRNRVASNSLCQAAWMQNAGEDKRGQRTLNRSSIMAGTMAAVTGVLCSRLQTCTPFMKKKTPPSLHNQ